MRHESVQAQILYILEGIDYSKSLEEVEFNLGYTLGDHLFDSPETYKVVRQAVKNLWIVLHDHLDSKGGVINHGRYEVDITPR